MSQFEPRFVRVSMNPAGRQMVHAPDGAVLGALLDVGGVSVRLLKAGPAHPAGGLLYEWEPAEAAATESEPDADADTEPPAKNHRGHSKRAR